LTGAAQHHGRLGTRSAQLEGGDESIYHPLRRALHACSPRQRKIRRLSMRTSPNRGASGGLAGA
jgi:hypothetical protein